MAKRVSVKGKGADMFFGEYPLGPEAPLDDEPSANHPPPLTGQAGHASANGQDQEHEMDSVRPSQDARIHASKHEGEHASEPEDEPSTAEKLDALDVIWGHMLGQATISNSFRYTEHDLEWFDDVLYALSKQHGLKLTKQDVARLGLNALFWDYESNGDASLLSQYALRKKRQRGG